MTFTALTGAISHFAIGQLPDLTILLLCIIFTLIWARVGAYIANKTTEKNLNLLTGVILLSLGIVMVVVNLFK